MSQWQLEKRGKDFQGWPERGRCGEMQRLAGIIGPGTVLKNVGEQWFSVGDNRRPHCPTAPPRPLAATLSARLANGITSELQCYQRQALPVPSQSDLLRTSFALHISCHLAPTEQVPNTSAPPGQDCSVIPAAPQPWPPIHAQQQQPVCIIMHKLHGWLKKWNDDTNESSNIPLPPAAQHGTFLAPARRSNRAPKSTAWQSSMLTFVPP
ncbi:hypothetical protein GX51_03783 [Blastomyces parvus]|uniref:Uncharacterized protein n=1 Tax=Blastomyces parvus TaxID=2060905 RepID=A0A2B7X4G1_9EURO|nr:hypothetical protein GX51_03783 [Blastomyces parvus]